MPSFKNDSNGIITQYIPDLIGSVVSKVDTALYSADAEDPFPHVFYDFGHYQEVVKNLDEKDKSISNKVKYPLIWLVMDFEEKMGKALGIYASVRLQFIIAVDTKASYTMQERRDKSFLPVLYPIYSEFLKQLSSQFGTPVDKMVHTKIDRPYWGIQSGLGNGEANLFNDFIDAIQIKDLELNIKRKIC